jgi:O-antigen ligase
VKQRVLTAWPAANFPFGRVLRSVALALVLAVLALFFGLFVALFPSSMSAKLVIVLALPVVFIGALYSTTNKSTDHGETVARRLFLVWVFLLGACPAYIPFKLDPLPGLNPIRVMFGLLAVVWVFAYISSPALKERLSQRLRGSPIGFFLIMAFAVWQLVAAALGDAPVYSLYYSAKMMLTGVFFFLVAVSIIRDDSDLKAFAVAVTLGAIVAATAAIVEWRIQANLFLRFLPSDPQELAALEWIIADKSREGSYRVSGTFSHPLVLGEYLVMALPASLALIFINGKVSFRLLGWLAVPLILFGIYLSQTRSSVLAVAMVAFVFMILTAIRGVRQRRSLGIALAGWMSLVVAIGLSVFLVSASLYLAEGRNLSEAGSTEARFLMLERATRLVLDQPIQGYGPGTAAFKIGFLPGMRSLTIDSYFLSIAIESGLLGLVLWIAINIRSGHAAVVGSLSGSTQRAGVLYAAVAAMMAASIVMKLVLSLTTNINLLFVVFGLCIVVTSLVTRSTRSSQGSLSPHASQRLSLN